MAFKSLLKYWNVHHFYQCKVLEATNIYVTIIQQRLKVLEGDRRSKTQEIDSHCGGKNNMTHSMFKREDIFFKFILYTDSMSTDAPRKGEQKLPISLRGKINQG